MSERKPIIGFIGQGYVGKNYADSFEERGYPTVRYALEEPFVQNKDKIKECDYVYIGVPTPTTPNGFDGSIVEGSFALLRDGAVAIVKSTIAPGTTRAWQEKYPHITILYSPEFLSESTAREDVQNPFSNIVGVARDTDEARAHAQAVIDMSPPAPYTLICTSTEAELIKYSHNGSGYVQIIFFNMMYDLAQKLGCEWDLIEKSIEADPYVCNRYARPVHKSGRGAGGNCFIKDFATLRETYMKHMQDTFSFAVFQALEEKNKRLLADSGKDIHLLKGVYGEDVA